MRDGYYGYVRTEYSTGLTVFTIIFGLIAFMFLMSAVMLRNGQDLSTIFVGDNNGDSARISQLERENDRLQAQRDLLEITKIIDERADKHVSDVKELSGGTSDILVTFLIVLLVVAVAFFAYTNYQYQKMFMASLASGNSRNTDSGRTIRIERKQTNRITGNKGGVPKVIVRGRKRISTSKR